MRVINTILREWAQRVDDGQPNPQNPEHITELVNSLVKYDLPESFIYEFVGNLMDGPTLITEKEEKFYAKNTETDELIDFNSEEARDKAVDEKPNYEKADKNDDEKGQDDDTSKEDSEKSKYNPETDDEKSDRPNTMASGAGLLPVEKKAIKKAKDSNTPQIEQQQYKTTQLELQQKRDMGDAGAGGAIASQGESIYCSALNSLDVKVFTQHNKEQINSILEQMNSRSGRSKFPTSAESVTLRSLGIEPTDPSGAEYIAIREAFAQNELERIKNIPNSVFYLKGKKGFDGKDEPYLEWARVAYDGTLSTRKILAEDTNLDTSKPHTTLQSEKDIDNEVQSKLTNLLANATKDKNQDDITHYQSELKSFKKFRKYHDTFVIGVDDRGRTTTVSVSNKKDDNLKDPHNNTTPKSRFGVIKEQYGKEAAATITKALDTAIETVSDVKQQSVQSSNLVNIDDTMISILNIPEMSKYMNQLENNTGYNNYLKSQGKDITLLSTQEKVKLMQEHSQLLLDSNKKPAFEPYGKIMTKVGEISTSKKLRTKYPDINFDDHSVKKCVDIKHNEKTAVNSSHDKVVNSIRNADKVLGFPKDGINGPNVSGYISTVMDAMHFDSYIDGGDGKMIVQMGIRGAQPQDIRGCLASNTGYKGDVTTIDGKEGLKKHLRQTCKIDSKSGAIIMNSDDGVNSICTDTWRTAGTSQKVASGYGDSMRKCISTKVDTRRSN